MSEQVDHSSGVRIRTFADDLRAARLHLQGSPLPDQASIVRRSSNNHIHPGAPLRGSRDLCSCGRTRRLSGPAKAGTGGLMR